MVPQTKNFENISVNIYEPGSFTKFNERDPDTKFFDDIRKSDFETSYFRPNEVKPYLQSTQYLEKLNVLHVNIRSIKCNFENLKALFEECELVFNIICDSETWCSSETPNYKTIIIFLLLDSILFLTKEVKRVGGEAEF